MLPSCDRIVNVPRKDIYPVWTRSFPVSKQTQTIGEHLRKERLDLGLRQSQVAHKLKISDRTLSLWECDRVYPTWEYRPRLIEVPGLGSVPGFIHTPKTRRSNHRTIPAFLVNPQSYCRWCYGSWDRESRSRENQEARYLPEESTVNLFE